MTDTIMALIERRRRQMHVHSVMYYHMNNNLVTDHQFDEWAVELRELQTTHPDLAVRGYMAQEFKNWTGDTGMHLPVTRDVVSLAQHLLNYDAKLKRRKTMARLQLFMDWDDEGESAGWQEEVVFKLEEFQMNDELAKRVSDYVSRSLEYLAREIEAIAVAEFKKKKTNNECE